MKTFLASAFAFAIAFSAVSVYAEKIDIAKVKCLISGAAAKEDKAADWKDGKVYFCCGNCQKKFNDDSKAFAAKANHQLIATEQVTQGACPFSGGDLNKDTAIEFKGAKISFCCNNCKGKAEKMSDDDKVEKLFGEAAYEKAKFAKAEKK
jgi:YHS domain-containing protein